MDIIKGTHKDLGTAWKGEVIEVLADDADEFYNQSRYADFTGKGNDAFLRAMGIPPAFFENQTQPTQEAILTRQKQTLREAAPSALLLVKENKIVNAAPRALLGWEDPSIVMGLCASAGYRDVGDFRYATVVPGKAEFSPAILVAVDTFYNRPTKVCIGVHRSKDDAVWIDKKNCGILHLSTKEFKSETFAALMAGLRSAVQDMEGAYSSFVTYLHKKGTTIPEARALVTAFTEQRSVPKTLLDRVMSHLDLLSAGQETDPGTPKLVETEYQLMDVFSHYMPKLPTVASRLKAEGAIFEHFYTKAQAVGSVPRVSVRARVEAAHRKLVEVKEPASLKVDL